MLDKLLRITPSLAIPLDQFEFTFIRARGPGGQHVNKSSTAVQLRFDVRGSQFLDNGTRNRLLGIAGNRITAAGQLILTAQRFRSREQNRRDALERIAKLLQRASVKPKNRKPTKVPKRQRRRRLDEKKRRATTKQLRATPKNGY